MEFYEKLVPNSSRIPNLCDLGCARTYIWICSFCCFLASAKRVALLFGGCLKKVRPGLRNAGRAFSQVGKFLRVSPDFSACWPQILIQMSLIYSSCDLRCATRVALWDSLDWKSCDLLCSSDGHIKQWSRFSNKLSPGKWISKVYNFVYTLGEFSISMDRFERLWINLGVFLWFEHVLDVFVTRLSGSKWVAVARHGLILWENEATILGIIFKCLPGLWDTI